MMSIAAQAAAQAAGGAAVEKICVRARFHNQSISTRLPLTKPPREPSALLNVPMRIATRFSTFNSSQTPRPALPKTPVAWASSTKRSAPQRAAMAASSAERRRARRPC